MPIRDDLLQFMQEQAYRPLTFAELVDVFSVPAAERDAFRRMLDEMEAEGSVVRTRTMRFGVPERMNLVVGTFQGHMKGFGFVLPDRADEDDVFVPPEAGGGAMHGDRVVARVESTADDGRRRQGEIIRILTRSVTRVVGTLERHRGHGFVIPDDRRITQDVYIAKSDMAGARGGEKVVVDITHWPSARRGAEGRVVERLGKAGEAGVDVRSLMVQFDLPADFPKDVQAEAERVPEAVAAEDLEGRLDLRELVTFTIDGEDAKDLDDAVSLEQTKRGWRLGVHIADVSHYVQAGTPLDKEARERGTSVYLVDRVIPMLPPRLSNGICSLNPDVDRLTLSALIEFDHDGQIVSHKLASSVIHSHHRLTYTAVQAMMDGDKTLRREYADIAGIIDDMDKLAQTLRQARRERGSIDFDLPEPQVILDEAGIVKNVEQRRQDRAHQLIEEFMLAANETVAQHFLALNVPLIYRVHETPDPDRVKSFEEFLFNFGIPFHAGKEPTPKQFQQVLQRIQGMDEEHLITAVMLRTMRQARYATEPLGHFGLAARFYTHFTSPIRRYPDLTVHRIAHEVVDRGRLAAKRVGVLLRELPETAAHCSRMERHAMDAERESVTLKLLQYMQARIGDEFDGVVAGVTAFGLFVQLPNLAEGLVHVSTLNDDYYKFHEKHYALIGERSGRRYRLGDRVRVRVDRVDLQQRQMDFALIVKNRRARKPAAKKDQADGGAAVDQEPAAAAKPKRKSSGRSRKKAAPKAAPTAETAAATTAADEVAAVGTPNEGSEGAGDAEAKAAAKDGKKPRPRRRRSSRKRGSTANSGEANGSAANGQEAQAAVAAADAPSKNPPPGAEAGNNGATSAGDEAAAAEAAANQGGNGRRRRRRSGGRRKKKTPAAAIQGND